MFKGFESRKIDVAGVEIACVVAGLQHTNRTPILMLHGFPQTKAMWNRIAPLLAEHHPVVCADLRGYGDSAHPPCLPDASNYSFRAMAADQIGLMRHLGFERFHLIGHDRGARTSHRLALDHPQAVTSLTLMDIVPTTVLFNETNQQLASAYWHWYFLSQPAPFPERLIEANPDYFYETCLLGWGSAKLEQFDAEQLADYRRCWRKPSMIQGSCGDYRAAASIDLALDMTDITTQLGCPSLVFYGEHGVMNKLYDIAAQWQKRLSNLETASLPGGHFFPDMLPVDTAHILLNFIQKQEALLQNR
jgi:haloacetate dehalogenase